LQLLGGTMFQRVSIYNCYWKAVERFKDADAIQATIGSAGMGEGDFCSVMVFYRDKPEPIIYRAKTEKLLLDNIKANKTYKA